MEEEKDGAKKEILANEEKSVLSVVVFFNVI